MQDWFSTRETKRFETDAYGNVSNEFLIEGSTHVNGLPVELLEGNVHEFHADPAIALCIKMEIEWLFIWHTQETFSRIVHSSCFGSRINKEVLANNLFCDL